MASHTLHLLTCYTVSMRWRVWDRAKWVPVYGNEATSVLIFSRGVLCTLDSGYAQ